MDYMPPADADALEMIARARDLTKEYYLSDYRDKEKRRRILKELFGSMGENVVIDTPFYCD